MCVFFYIDELPFTFDLMDIDSEYSILHADEYAYVSFISLIFSALFIWNSRAKQKKFQKQQKKWQNINNFFIEVGILFYKFSKPFERFSIPFFLYMNKKLYPSFIDIHTHTFETKQFELCLWLSSIFHFPNEQFFLAKNKKQTKF